MSMADEVARAIVTAARELGVHPLQVVNAMPAKSHEHVAVSRARSYAALALDEVYNIPNATNSRAEHNVPRRSIARLVGAFPGSVDSMVKALRNKIDTGQLKWWKASIFEEVVASVYAEGKRRRIAPQTAWAPAAAPEAVCEECGGPRSKYSSRVCRNCYRGMTSTPKTAPSLALAPAAAPPAHDAMPVTIERNGIKVIVGHSGALVTHDGGEVTITDAAAAAVIAALAKVSPALLPTDRIATQAFGTVQSAYKIADAVEPANRMLGHVGLRVRYMPKVGYSLSAA